MEGLGKEMSLVAYIRAIKDMHDVVTTCMRTQGGVIEDNSESL